MSAKTLKLKTAVLWGISTSEPKDITCSLYLRLPELPLKIINQSGPRSHQFCSAKAQSCPTLRPYELQHARVPCPITSSQSLLKLISIQSVMPSNHLILSCPLLLPSTFPSIRVFSNESVLHIRWPKYWSFSISPSNEYSGLISSRMDWLDLLAVQGTLKSILKVT